MFCVLLIRSAQGFLRLLEQLFGYKGLMTVIHNDPVIKRRSLLPSNTDLFPDTLAEYRASNVLTVTDDVVDCLRPPVIVVPVIMCAWCADLYLGRRGNSFRIQ